MNKKCKEELIRKKKRAIKSGSSRFNTIKIIGVEYFTLQAKNFTDQLCEEIIIVKERSCNLLQ